MRPVRLARIAAEAEGVRLRGLLNRQVTRIMMAAIALVFGVGALTFAHVAAWYGLRVCLEQTYLATTGILGGADLLFAVVLLVLASRSKPSRVEVEALEVRRKAIQGIGSSLSMVQMVIPILRFIAYRRRRRRD
jgi:hypothetical protein